VPVLLVEGAEAPEIVLMVDNTADVAAAVVVVEDSFRLHSYTSAEEVYRGAVVEVVTLRLRVGTRSLFLL